MMSTYIRHATMCLIVLMMVVMLIVVYIGNQLITPALVSIGQPPTDLPCQIVSFKDEKQQHISGWLIRGQPNAGVILLLHGVRSNRLSMLNRARFLHQQGYAVLLIDLPAHGESPANSITFGLNESYGVRAAIHYLHQQLPNQKIGVIATSLGAASLVFTAAHIDVDAVVLESMYPTIDEAVGNRLQRHVGIFSHIFAPLLLWQLPIRLDIDPQQLRPIDHLSQLDAPIFIISGAQDQHTTLSETQRLFAVAPQPKTLWMVKGAAHIDLHQFAQTHYEYKISVFFKKHLRDQSIGLS